MSDQSSVAQPAVAGSIHSGQAGAGVPQHLPPPPQARPFRCHLCPSTSKTSGNLENHIKSMHIGTQCCWSGCRAIMGTEQELRRHITRAHRHEKLSETEYRCCWLYPNGTTCGKVFEHKSSANRCGVFHQFYEHERRQDQIAQNRTNVQNRPNVQQN
ncbi:hypothetical protein GGS26DRAFT_586958 [Hypomontagnella submonticulosa]|nr:hypothetical protein GGS26DRAFT_586958 [Hypomontagnella submonticulosa]